MIDIFVNSLIIIFVYIIVFALYFATVVVMSSKKRRLDIKQKYMTNAYNNNLVIIIYAQNNEKTVVPLLEQLNKQNYPKSNYQIHIILDNCTDNSANMLEFIGGAKVWRLVEGTPLGKDESISWLLERLISFQNVNAFVFLNANRMINADFLASVNSALFSNDVVVGSTNLVSEEDNFKFRLMDAINKYRNSIIKTGRSVLGLAARIDSDVVAIKQEVLEKIRCVDFKDTNSELKYTILLARNNFIPLYNPNIQTWADVNDFNFKKPDLSFKFSLFKHCCPLLFNANLKFAEFLFSMFTPNVLLLTVLYVSIAIFSYNYYFFFDYYFVFAIGIILLASFIASVILMKVDKSTIKYLLIYPFHSFYEKFLKNSFIFKLVNRSSQGDSNTNIEQATIDVEVTDGKNSIPCKLDLISEDGLVKVIFKFKKKKYVTDSHIRMCDAIKNITDKLYGHGFRIKICQTCAYFSSKIDGTTNMIKGYCNKQVVADELSEPEEKLLWSSCQFYLPEDLNKIVDISNYKKKLD